MLDIGVTSQKAPVCVYIVTGRDWRMKLLRESNNVSFLSESINISDDDSVSDTSVMAEFEVAPYHFEPKLSAESE